MARFSVKELSAAGLIASLYAILSLVFMPISFGVYQIRVAEALTVLPFLTRAAIPGLYVGCLLANILGGMGWLDIVFGPLITLAAAFLTRAVYYLSRRPGSNILALLPAVMMWAGAVCFLSEFTLTARSAVGACVSAASFGIIVAAERMDTDAAVSSVTVWIFRLGALAVAAVSIVFLKVTSDANFVFVGGTMLVAALLTTVILARVWFSGNSPNMLIAPLPPVVLNAFGVSAYLAPLIGVNYWFSVQMVGVGQLIACYLIGLPVLMALKQREILS